MNAETLERLEREGDRFERMLLRRREQVRQGSIPKMKTLQHLESATNKEGVIDCFIDLDQLGY